MSDMKELFTYYEGGLEDFINEALVTKDRLVKRIISIPTESLIHDLSAQRIEIDRSFLLRGQIPITCLDLLKIPDIVSDYDSLSTDKNKRGQDLIIYSKSFNQDNTYYVEEIRLGRHELAACSIYKKKKG